MNRISTFLVSLVMSVLTFGVGLSLAQQAPRAPMGAAGDMGPGRMMSMPGRGMMGMGECPMMGMMMGGAEMPTFGEGRIAFLKAELGITPAQQAAWDAYAAALTKNFASMQGMQQSMMTALEGKTPVERLEAHLTAMEGRLTVLKEIKPALTTLYAALSDDQKKKADATLTGMGCMM